MASLDTEVGNEFTAVDQEAAAEYGIQDELDVDDEDALQNNKKKPEPSYKLANGLKFFTVCERLNTLWDRMRRRKPQRSLEDRLHYLLPPKVLETFENTTKDPQPESLFPLFRLLMPEKDSSRYFNMKEKVLAKVYAEALQLSDHSPDYQKLMHWTDPTIVGTDGAVGDFSLVLEKVIALRIPHKKGAGSDFTVGDINDMLDKLAKFGGSASASARWSNNKTTTTTTTSHDWRAKSSSSDGGEPTRKKAKKMTLQQERAKWVRELNPTHGNKKGLSPLEHKWLVRIIMQRLQFGIGGNVLLNWYNPLGSELYSTHNSLRGVCNELCDPDFVQMGKALKEEAGKEKKGLASYMPRPELAIRFGIPFQPMYSERTGFERVLTDISYRHREFIKSQDSDENAGGTLALLHPAFTVETKLDGERIIIHYSRDGVVKMHTRQCNWYSELYSPVLGPAIRRALGKHDMDIILDGEILSWDDGRQETIPFGNNRTVAKLRKKWMKSQGLCDDRDRNMHDSDKEIKSMNASNAKNDRNDQPFELEGRDCWLQYVAFDVLYVDGPGAAELLEETVSSCIEPRPTPGSILGLDGTERKKILYRLVEPQEREVEIVKTHVVRPDGSTLPGSQYFVTDNPIKEYGLPVYTLDSIECNLSGSIPELDRIDIERRKKLSDDQIAQARAHAIDKLYKRIVEDSRQEGLVFKDLSAPYCPGEKSRALRYWHKFKPDYFNGSVASDLDLVIIGAYFGTGLRHGGRPSSFLCACVDSEDRNYFFPLCKVNGGSVDRQALQGLLDSTGFKYPKDGTIGASEYGKWKVGDGKFLPDFISRRSRQSSNVGPDDWHYNEDGGWRFEKKDYPDLWIDPSESTVVTINAGEIVYSGAFSPGLTLRFPRITRLREGADGKAPDDIESEKSLWRIYQEVGQDRATYDADAAYRMGSPAAKSVDSGTCRFLTEDQFVAEKKKKKVRKSKKPLGVKTAPDVPVESSALKNLTFTVLDGTYALPEKGIDADEAREEGWYDEARTVTNKESVQVFIKKHGGKVNLTPNDNTLVLGGRPEDERVKKYVTAIENASSRVTEIRSKAQTKTAIENMKMAMQDGVLRWTFVYSLVYRWKAKRENQDGEAGSILENDKDMLKPTILSYLLRPVRQGDENRGAESELCREELASAIAMRRAIDEVGRRGTTVFSKKARKEEPERTICPWPYEAVSHLDPTDRWVLSCNRQVLWPYAADGETTGSAVVLYPDFFDDDFGYLLEEDAVDETLSLAHGSRWEKATSSFESGRLRSVLPLARAMGAVVTPHLHRGVTHVLCNLIVGCDQIKSLDDVIDTSFTDPERGQRLIDRLRTLSSDPDAVVLISPAWIKRKWQETN